MAAEDSYERLVIHAKDRIQFAKGADEISTILDPVRRAPPRGIDISSYLMQILRAAPSRFTMETLRVLCLTWSIKQALLSVSDRIVDLFRTSDQMEAAFRLLGGYDVLPAASASTRTASAAQAQPPAAQSESHSTAADYESSCEEGSVQMDIDPDPQSTEARLLALVSLDAEPVVCHICYVRKNAISLLPCKHKICATCAYSICFPENQQPSKGCPFCRGAVANFVRLKRREGEKE